MYAHENIHVFSLNMGILIFFKINLGRTFSEGGNYLNALQATSVETVTFSVETVAFTSIFHGYKGPIKFHKTYLPNTSFKAFSY